MDGPLCHLHAACPNTTIQSVLLALSPTSPESLLTAVGWRCAGDAMATGRAQLTLEDQATDLADAAHQAIAHAKALEKAAIQADTQIIKSKVGYRD